MAESLAPTEVPLVGDFSTYSPNPAFADARVGVVTFPGTLDDRDAARAVRPVSYTHLTLPTMSLVCRSRWSPYH